jgi:hypothetical protein
MKHYLSVDLDFFNHYPATGLDCLISFLVTRRITNVSLFGDHLPQLAFKRTRWRGATVWNYDEHDDTAVGGDIDIGNWGWHVLRTGGKLIWLHPPSRSKESANASPDVEHLVKDGEEFPLPVIPEGEVLQGAAFFTSPGYLKNTLVVVALLHRFYWNAILVNKTDPADWTIRQLTDAAHNKHFGYD